MHVPSCTYALKKCEPCLFHHKDTYELDTHDLAEGKIKDATATESLTAEDCFKIGRTAYLEEDYYHCALWMREADARILNGDTSYER